MATAPDEATIRPLTVPRMVEKAIDEAHGVLDLSPGLMPRGLELHIYLCADGAEAMWVSEDGSVLGDVVVGRA